MLEQYTFQTRIGKALANPYRIAILYLLMDNDEITASEIAKTFSLSAINVCRHLGVLSKCGLVKSQRHDRNVYYSIANKSVVDLFAALRKMCDEHQANLMALVNAIGVES